MQSTVQPDSGYRSEDSSSNLELLEVKGYLERSSVSDDARLKKITLIEKAVKGK